MLNEFKLTDKQKNLVMEIAKSHPYFPELALDDFTFKNNLYIAKDLIISDLIERGIIKKDGKKLLLNKLMAKRHWKEILSWFPEDKPLKFDREFVESKPIGTLKKAYSSLKDIPVSQVELSKEELTSEIYNELYSRKVNTMEKDFEYMSPKQAGEELGISASAFRKLAREVFGKPTDGNWKLDKEKVEKVAKYWEEKRAKIAKNRKELGAKLAKARLAKAKVEKKPAEVKVAEAKVEKK